MKLAKTMFAVAIAVSMWGCGQGIDEQAILEEASLGQTEQASLSSLTGSWRGTSFQNQGTVVAIYNTGSGFITVDNLGCYSGSNNTLYFEYIYYSTTTNGNLIYYGQTWYTGATCAQKTSTNTTLTLAKANGSATYNWLEQNSPSVGVRYTWTR